MTLRFATALQAASVIVLLAAASAQAELPRIERPVTDRAGALAPSDLARLESRLTKLAAGTGVHASVVIVPDTAGLPLEDYSLALAETWAGGSAGSDRGLLLLLATRQRAMRLEVGYGLEANLPDGLARSLLEAGHPSLLDGRWSEALGLVIDGIETHTAGLVPDAAIPGSSRPLGRRLPLAFLIVLGAAVGTATLVRKRGGILLPLTLFGAGPLVVAAIFREGAHWWWGHALTWIVGAGTAISLLALRPSHGRIVNWMAGGFVGGALLTLLLPFGWQDNARPGDLLLLLATCVGTTLAAPALPWLLRRPHLLHLLLRTLLMAGGATYGRGGRLPSSGDWSGRSGGFGGGGAGKQW